MVVVVGGVVVVVGGVVTVLARQHVRSQNSRRTPEHRPSAAVVKQNNDENWSVLPEQLSAGGALVVTVALLVAAVELVTVGQVNPVERAEGWVCRWIMDRVRLFMSIRLADVL